MSQHCVNRRQNGTNARRKPLIVQDVADLSLDGLLDGRTDVALAVVDFVQPNPDFVCPCG